MFQRKEPYHEAGADFFDHHRPEEVANRLVKRSERLGYDVTYKSRLPPRWPDLSVYFQVSITFKRTTSRICLEVLHTEREARS